MKIISINTGSSSLKFSLFNMDKEEVIASGLFERIGLEGSSYTIKFNGEKIKEEIELANHTDAVKVLLEKLISKNIQVATMESCTSGLIASNITDYEGASQILKGSLITYSNEAKMMAGVSSSIISEFGVYSKETAIEMAWNTKNHFHSDIGIGVTGSFGNVDPANKDSVPGIVYFNISYKKPFDFMLEYHDINLSRKEMKQKTVDIILATVNLFVPNKE